MMGETSFLAEIIDESWRVCVDSMTIFVERAEWTFGSFERDSFGKRQNTAFRV